MLIAKKELNPFVDMIQGAMKMGAIKFHEYASKKYQLVTSKDKTVKPAYVNFNNDILTFGSDEYLTKLIKKYGKTIDEVYECFLKHEKARIESEKKATEDNQSKE